MKKHLLLLLLLIFSINLTAQKKSITEPVSEFQLSGLMNVSRIELDKKETRLYVHCTFLPGWWVSFSQDNFIEDSETGEKLYAQNIRQGEFDKQIPMPASGDSTFILVFPALDKKTKKINFGKSEETYVFGVSLNPREKREIIPSEVPEDIQQWMDNELALAREKRLADLDPENFFCTDSARIVGYIKGYDARAKFPPGIIYAANNVTREDDPAVVQLHEDGRFEVTFLIIHPTRNYISFDRNPIPFYIEPGQTLAIVADWNDFIKADRYRSGIHIFENTQFKGATGQINKELLKASKQVNYPDFNIVYKDEGKKMLPDEIKGLLQVYDQTSINLLNEWLAVNQVTERTRTLLEKERSLLKPVAMMNYSMDVSYRNRDSDTPIDIPLPFFDFLKDIDLGDLMLMTDRNFRIFINRLEYSKPFDARNDVYKEISPAKTFNEYLFKELGLVKTAEDIEYEVLSDSLNGLFRKGKTPGEMKLLLQQHLETGNRFMERYGNLHLEYTDKYLSRVKSFTQGEIQMRIWEIQDSIYYQTLQLPESYINEMIKVRELDFLFKKTLKDKAEAEKVLLALQDKLQSPFFKSEANRLFIKYHPEEGKKNYVLPPGKGTDVFRNITDPFKGKYLFVDFWGIYCGPCIQGIKTMKPDRLKYKDHPDVEFIFITSERESPIGRYNTFVEEQELEHTFRISDSDYLELRQLFKFNGIPRYIMVDREGNIIDDNFSMYSFKYTLEKLLEEESKEI